MKQTRLKLMDRISRRYRTFTMRVQLKGLDLPFTRIAEPDRVLDDAVAEEDLRLKFPDRAPSLPPRIPYWAELWESALGLGQALGRTIKPCVSVLDLGCGMGLAGAAAAARGWPVLMADLEPTALLLARLNTLNWHNRVRVRRVDWRRDRLGETFDLILGADILYERGQWDFLHAFWQAHLTPGGCVLLGEPGRQTGDLFPQWAQERAWSVSQSMESVASLSRPVRIFTLQRQ